MRLLNARFEGVSLLKKNRNRCREEIDAFVILMCLSNNLIPKRIGHWKLDNQIAFIAMQNVYWNIQDPYLQGILSVKFGMLTKMFEKLHSILFVKGCLSIKKQAF